MKQLIRIIFCLLIAGQFCYSSLPYISPGLGVSWDFHGHFIVSPKLSIGIGNNNTFYNLTIGRSTSSETTKYPHIFIEVQTGHLTEPLDYRMIQLYLGGGIGLTIPTGSSSTGVSLRGSLFGGYGLFINTTILFEEKIRTELGLQLVAPIPLGEVPPLGPGKI
jgi:hypothetical protein